MSLPYLVRAEAEAEIVEVAQHYEQERPGLGAQFFTRVRDAVLLAAEAPEACAPVRGVAGLAVRCLSVRRFPYRVVFLHEPDLVLVLAVAHKRRRPGYWRDRLSGE